MNPSDTQTPAEENPQTEDTSQKQEQSEASGLAEQEAPEANQNEEEKDSGEKAEDTAEERLLAGKYKTTEDLEAAYKQLESKFGHKSNQVAELNSALTESLEQSQEAEVQTETESEEHQSTQPKVQPSASEDNRDRDIAVMKFVMTRGNEVSPEQTQEINKVLQSDPIVSQISTTEGKLEYAYQKSRNATNQQAMQKAQEEAQKETKAKMAEKEAAQVESGKKAEQPDGKEQLLSQAREGGPEEAKKARERLIREQLTNL